MTRSKLTPSVTLPLPLALLALALGACGTAPPPEPAPDWAGICGRHCAGEPAQVRVGAHQVCLRYAGGAVLCWGEVRGRTDDVDPHLVTTEVDGHVLEHDDAARATALVDGLLDANDLTCGDSFCCAIRGDHSLACWGMLDRWDAPGRGAASGDPRLPAAVPGVDDATAFIGRGHAQLALSALDQDMLALGARVSRSPPSDWPYAPVTSVAYSDDGPTMVADGKVYALCFSGAPGRCGLEFEQDEVFPEFMLPISGLDDVVSVASRDDTRCALRASGEVWCWGAARVIWEQTEHGDHESPRASRPTRVDALSDITVLKASDHGFCALRADHQLLCWGVDTSRILRTGHDDGERWQPYLLPDAADVVDFDLNDAALCVIREGADVACSDLLPPDVPRHGRHRGQLVRVPGLPELPADFADEPTGDVSAVDAGAI